MSDDKGKDIMYKLGGVAGLFLALGVAGGVAVGKGGGQAIDAKLVAFSCRNDLSAESFWTKGAARFSGCQAVFEVTQNGEKLPNRTYTFNANGIPHGAMGKSLQGDVPRAALECIGAFFGGKFDGIAELK